jgi:hypothetical protein
LKGDFAELRSKRRALQELVGWGGTLWIIVSRARRGRRLYSLTFKLVACEAWDYERAGDFGRFAVVGDRDRSAYFASNDAELLLMSLRFKGFRPIRSVNVIGQSIQTPRRLTAADVALLNRYSKQSDRWSAFVSHSRKDGSAVARRLVKGLERTGISTFGDEERLIVGTDFPRKIRRAVQSCRYFLILVSSESANSDWMSRELEWALGSKHPPRIVPIVLPGGDLRCFPALKDVQALTWRRGPFRPFLTGLVSQLRAAA